MPIRLSLCVFVIFAILVLGCDSTEANDPIEIPSPQEVADSLYTLTENGVKIYDFDVGTGTEVQDSVAVQLHYIVWLQNELFVDSSYLRGVPSTFLLGRNQLIVGFEEGLMGMKVGGYRQMVIPPELAYGADGSSSGNVPPNSTLIYEVALLAVGVPTN